MTTQVRSKLIASGNVKPAARPQTIKADPVAIRARFMELNKRKVQTAVAVLAARVDHHD